MKQAFVSWSGGKDSCFSCYRAISNGLEVRCLANMATEDGKRSRSHGLNIEVLQMQSEALGIPLVQRKTTWKDYEAKFLNMLHTFKQDGITDGIFGDIDLDEHRQWVETVCGKASITPHLPLWMESQDKILEDFIAQGFDSIIVATKANIFGEEWLGRKIDLDFIRDLAELKKTKDITPCGEAGEYHTLVIDGPLFRKRVEILKTKKVLRDGRWFLEIQDADLRTR